MSVPVSIIIPAYNQLEYCRQCVASIQANTRPPYRLILVDNASTDGVGAFFDEVAGAEAVHAPENLGFAGGVNLGLARAEGHAVILNSDTIVPPGWLERLSAALLHEADVGLAGPRSNCVSGSQEIPGLALESYGAIMDYAAERARTHAGQRRDVARLVGFCMMIRDAVLAELGGFDEAYGIGNFEDDDYCLRALRAGWRLCVAEDCFVFHYGSRTFLGMGIVDGAWDALLQGNQARFEEKWRVRPEERHDGVQMARALCRKARAAAGAGELVDALRILRDAVAAAPWYEETHNDLGAVLWQLGEGERACRQFRRALECNPGHEAARANLRDAAAALGPESVRDAASFLDALAQERGGCADG